MQPAKVDIQDSRSSNSRAEFQGGPVVSIIGAGVMGRGIAEAALRAGMIVRISDSSNSAATAAVEHILTARESDAKQHPRLVDPIAGPLLTVATDDADVANADLIIEAVPENLALKTAILSRIEPHLRSGTIIASNSSSLSIAQLSAALQAPGRFCGMHFPRSTSPVV